MSDTMPERVIIEQNDGMLYAWYDEGQCATPENYYVPEQRALDAERERDALLAGGERAVLDYMSRKSDRLKEENAALRAERDALQSDLKALLPLARYALPVWQSAGYSGDNIRAILDREGT